jgi:hypothetical protein
MNILGPFLSVEDADTFFFMRGFPDLPSRESMKAKFYDGELWKGELDELLRKTFVGFRVVSWIAFSLWGKKKTTHEPSTKFHESCL